MATIPIVHRLNDYYCLPAAVAFQTMLKRSSPEHEYHLYVLHSDITALHQEMLREVVSRFLNARIDFLVPQQSKTVNQLFAGTAKKAHFSAESYWSLFLPDVFPQLQRVISTDVDVMWMGDISEIWEFESRSWPAQWEIAGVRGLNPAKPNWLTRYYEKYRHDFTVDEVTKVVGGIGGGLLVMQLERMRSSCRSKDFLGFAMSNAARLRQIEQDVLNLVAHDVIAHLPLRHMVCTYFYDLCSDGLTPEDNTYSADEVAAALGDPIQLHFAGGLERKPWENPEAPFASLWIAELAETPFLREWIHRVRSRDERAQYARRLVSLRVPFRRNRRVSIVWHESD